MDKESIILALILSSSLKVVCVLAVATLLIYFGFRLFYLTESKAGSLEVESKFGKIRLLKATPGIFLTFFGTIILLVALFMGSKLKTPDIELNLGALASDGGVTAQRLCAVKVHWAINAVRSSPSYTQASGVEKSNIEENLDDLEAVLAQCVNSAIKPGAYRIYKSIQERIDKGEPVDGDEDIQKTYRSVSDLLSN